MSVICIRIPKEIKERMDKYRDKVRWSEEIRKFIEKRIDEIEKKEALEKIRELLRRMPIQPKGSISSIVREDRDRH